MGLTGRDIVCLSTHFWDERRFRKQEFMARFARANRVLFVEPSFSMVRRPEDHVEEVATNRYFIPRLAQRARNLHLLKPPRGVPGWTNPRLERLTYRWYGEVIRRTAERLGFDSALLWVYRPAFAHALDAIPHAQLVFDLVDDLAAYTDDAEGARHTEALVARLVERADLLVVTAGTLLERYGPSARAVAHVPNGFDASLFDPERAHDPPAALAGVPRPIIGFSGTLFSFLDFELMEAVARRHRDKSMVLVGPVEPNAADAVARLASLPNVFHVGPQPQQAMPAYVAAFDVCLNPFRRSRIADSVNPLKVYEYLAAGKPVVSTPMEALRREDAARMVTFAGSADEVCAAVERCLDDDTEAAAEKRRAAAMPYSWDRLFTRLDAACDTALTRSEAA